MKVFFTLLKVDLKRALLSFSFMASVGSILLIMFVSSSGFMSYAMIDVVHLIEHALTGSGSTFFILAIAPILPYGMSIALDIEEKVSPFWIIRSGTKKYAVSKFLSAIIAGFLSVMVSIIGFSLILSLFFPLLNVVSVGSSYATLLENNFPIRYILVIAFHYSLSGGLFAGGAIVISTFIPNKFSVVAMPIVIYFVLVRLTDLAPIPHFLKVSVLVQDIYPNVSPLASFLYKLIPIIVILFLLGSVTVKQIHRRMGIS